MKLHEISLKDILEGLKYIKAGYEYWVVANDDNNTLIVKNLTLDEYNLLKNLKEEYFNLNPKEMWGNDKYTFEIIKAVKLFQFVKNAVNKSINKNVMEVYF